MTSGHGARPACSQCGKKQLSPGGLFLDPQGLYRTAASICRACGCTTARGLLVAEPGPRRPSPTVRSNRRAVLRKIAAELRVEAASKLADADEIDAIATAWERGDT